ncbi:MAG TPA: N-6 DNA methylase, partial [Bacteroidia bacterium]|nr:N-6 DNA methylase [Bacteroidia bacterium]
ECIIALPKNIFYNTGIPTYIWIVSNKKAKNRKGKVQLINALDMSTKLRKNLGQKNCELTVDHIDQITQLYIDFKETEISKIFSNEYFGYNKITVERPLRLSAQFTDEAIASLRFDRTLEDEMKWAYEHFGDELYTDFDKCKPKIEAHLKLTDSALSASQRNKLLNGLHWQYHLDLMQAAEILAGVLGKQPFNDFNDFEPKLNKAIKKLKLELDGLAIKNLISAITYKNEDAEKVLSKKGKTTYEPDPDLRDTENVPLSEDIYEYFEREVLAHIPDAWIDENKTVTGYEISFTRYFYNYVPPRSLEEITAEILQLETETEGILNQIVNT